jgi:hypothetical protein
MVSGYGEMYYQIIILLIILWIPYSVSGQERREAEESLQKQQYKIGVCDWMKWNGVAGSLSRSRDKNEPTHEKKNFKYKYQILEDYISK